MKVFITWSGEKSKAVAHALKVWIPDVLNAVKTWMSVSDLGAGERWNVAIANELEKTRIGIICLTKSNLSEPWIMFEAGALAKSLKDSFVCPYLVDLDPLDIPKGPLTQFHAKRSTREETFQLISTLNSSLGDTKLSDDRLVRSFNRCWPDLEKQLKIAAKIKEEEPIERSLDEMVEEILDIVRNISRKSVNPTVINTSEDNDGTLIFFREGGGRGEWLTKDEVYDRISKEKHILKEEPTDIDDEEMKPGIPESLRNPQWG